jgi:hypothetical protein
MPVLQSRALLSSATRAMDQRQDLRRQRRDAPEPVAALAAGAQELPRLLGAAERAALGQALARGALDVPTLAGAGARSQRGVRCATTSPRAGGPGRGARSLSRRPHGAPAWCPRALRAGSSAGSWTPLAAQQAPWGGAPVTPQGGAARLPLWGPLPPSQRPRARLPKALRVPWAAQRPPCAAPLRHPEASATEAVAMAVARAGVRAPRHEGARPATRQRARAHGQGPRGPAGSQEGGVPPCPLLRAPACVWAPVVGPGCRRPTPPPARGHCPRRCGGRCARGPTSGSSQGRRARRTTGARSAPSSQGARRGGTSRRRLSGPPWEPSRGRARPRTRRAARRGVRCGAMRRRGGDPVLGALGRWRTRSPRRQARQKALASVREHRHRMRSRARRAQHWPRGSGGGAACQTRVRQRVQRSGRRWRTAGGQAILPLRALGQSERFARAWSLLGAT